MMSNVTAIHGQSLLDLCLQEYGTVEACIELAMANGFDVDRELIPGERIQLPEYDNIDNEIKQFFERQERTVQTLVFGSEITSAPVSCELNVSETIVSPDVEISVSWSTQNADNVLLNGVPVSSVGSMNVTINEISAFSLVAYNDQFYCSKQKLVLMSGGDGIGCSWTQIEW